MILHVVYRDGEPITLPDSRRLPTLELQNRISPELYDRYRHLIYGNQQIIPCEGSIRHVDDITLRNWLTRVLVERLEKRSVAVMKALEVNRGDWEETFYQFLAAQFRFKTNAAPLQPQAHRKTLVEVYALTPSKFPDHSPGTIRGIDRQIKSPVLESTQY